MAVYRRLEFTFTINKAKKVLAFIDFSSHISFGIPKSYQFTDYIVQPKSENYERITVHKDGKVKTHLPLAQHLPVPWDRQYSPLAKWAMPWTMLGELYWGSKAPSVRDYLATPKSVTTSPNTRQVQLTFPSGVEATQIRFSLFPSLTKYPTNVDIFAPEIWKPNYCTWVLADSWPFVLVTIRIPYTRQHCVQLKSVGRDYRVS